MKNNNKQSNNYKVYKIRERQRQIKLGNMQRKRNINYSRKEKSNIAYDYQPKGNKNNDLD